MHKHQLLEDEGGLGAARGLTQLRVFGRKNFVLALRNWKGTAGQLVSPFFIVLMLFGLQLLGDSILNASTPNPTPTPIGQYPVCHERNVPCKTIVYAPADIEWVKTLMQTVAAKSGLDYNTTFHEVSNPLPVLTNYTEKFEQDNETIYTHLLNNPNATQHAFIFTSGYEPGNNPFGEGFFSDVGYIVFYNGTQVYDYTLELMRVVDESVIELKGIGSNASIQADLNTFPIPVARISGFDAVAANGGVWFYVPSMITFFILLTEIVMEKELRLRLGMRMMGLMDSVYWSIYFFTGLIFIALTTLVLIFSGMIFQFDFFLNANFFTIFFMFLCFGIATNAFAFFLSTLVKTAATAQTMGYAIILVGFVFQIILCSGYGMLIDMLYAKEVAEWVKVIRWILTFYPPFNLALAFNNIAAASSKTIDITAGTITQGPGYGWDDLYKSRKMSLFDLNITVPSNSTIYWMLIMNAVVFFVLALYLDNVIPGDHGAPKPFYFFLTRNYWGFGKKRRPQDALASPSSSPSSTDVDVQDEARKAAAALMAKSPTGVQVLNLSKTYPTSIFGASDSDVKAVDNLCLSAEEGDILCILGHNGAGKTTTINMLVGLFPPTSGIGLIYGKDVTQEMAQIQRYMGVCPQHDILWNELTAREHLLIFAQLKGVSKEKVAAEIDEKLEMVGLTSTGNDRVGTYSGGMKRRLSVAIASIGEPKIIFLDEPTTGMDPVNRRSVWELIQKMKANRVIILTTHSMEEADILGDKISIMAHGNLCAVGNSLHLKNRYGIGYRINVTVSEMKNKKLVISEINNIVPEAVVLSSNAGNITFGVPLACREKMEPLLRYLEERSVTEHANTDKMEPFLKYLEEKSIDDARTSDKNLQRHRSKPVVKEWGLSHTSLEDVFLEVTKRENFTYPEEGQKDEQAQEGIKAETIDVSSEKDLSRYGTDDGPRNSYAFRALLRKNFALQKRQKGTNCCQIVTPILVMLILVILQFIIKSQLGDRVTATTINTFPIPLNAEFSTSIFRNADTTPSVASPPPLSPSSRFDDFLASVITPGTPTFSNFFDEFSRITTPSLRSAPSPLREDPPIPTNTTTNITTSCLEFFFFTRPASPTASALIGDLPSDNHTAKSGFLGAIPQKTCKLYNNTEVNIPYYVPRPNPAEMEKEVYDILMDYNKISLDDLQEGPYNYPLPDGTVEFRDANSDGTLSYVMSVNDNQISRYHRPNNFTRLGLEDVSSYSQGNTLIIVPGRLALMSMLHDAFIKYLTDVTYTALNTKFVQLMPYQSDPDIIGIMEIFGSFLYPIALSLQLPVYLYILVLEKADKLREMMGMHGLPKWTYYLSHYIFCFILYLFVIVFFYICGVASEIRLFAQTSFPVLALFFFAWGNALICMSMLFSTFISSKRASVVVGYLVALMGSLIAIVIAIGIYSDVTKKMPVAYFMWPQFAFVRCLYLLNNACAVNYQCYGNFNTIASNDEYISCVVALFLDAIVYYFIYLYLDQVMPREFGVPKHPLFFLGRFMPSRGEDEEKASLLADNGRTVARTFHDNQDIAHEKNRVKNKDYPRNAPLVIEDLSKKYPGASKYSLQSLYLAVESGECFSMLGENGAGKSTTISLLTGLYPPTHGTAMIAGNDITKEMGNARLTLGVCPQFNVLWDTLTVEEHLLFYARLKGVPPKDEKAHTQTWLTELGLTFAADRPSASLSGGMKRRVSVGIALVGNPKVVFLDEPTTGLDPASRRHLWTILERARPGRALILTTHSMDEAEVLSNRIGIMALGSMRCIGTPQHLKSSVGNLFHLKINFHQENIKLAENFVYSLFPHATLVRTYKGTSEFHIAQVGVLVSEVFAKMEASSEANEITDWSFSQVGLEEVFQMVVEESHKTK